MSDEYCPECGAKITGNTGFCSECGAVTTSLQNKIDETKKAKFEAEKRKIEKRNQSNQELKRKINKNKHWIILGVILVILLINLNTLFAIFFPQDTSIDISVEVPNSIKGGIVHIAVLDSNGKSFDSEETLNITMIDEKGNKGTVQDPIYRVGEEHVVGGYGDSIYRYGGGNDEAWKDLNVYGKYTITVQYPGELGYKPCNITKDIEINQKKSS